MDDLLPIYDVNTYVVNLLGSLLETSSGLVPIFPIQDEPEATTFDDPYIIYTVRTAPAPDAWWEMTDDVNYIIWHSDLNKITTIQRTLVEKFRTMDECADEINEYLYSIGRRQFYFLSFRVIGVNSPQPAKGEDARLGQPINFRYSYTING